VGPNVGFQAAGAGTVAPPLLPLLIKIVTIAGQALAFLSPHVLATIATFSSTAAAAATAATPPPPGLIAIRFGPNCGLFASSSFSLRGGEWLGNRPRSGRRRRRWCRPGGPRRPLGSSGLIEQPGTKPTRCRWSFRWT